MGSPFLSSTNGIALGGGGGEWKILQSAKDARVFRLFISRPNALSILPATPIRKKHQSFRSKLEGKSDLIRCADCD